LIQVIKSFIKNYDSIDLSQAQSVDLIKVSNNLQEKIRETIIFNSLHQKVIEADFPQELPRTHRDRAATQFGPTPPYFHPNQSAFEPATGSSPADFT
jgi:hypothetical protein